MNGAPGKTVIANSILQKILGFKIEAFFFEQCRSHFLIRQKPVDGQTCGLSFARFQYLFLQNWRGFKRAQSEIFVRQARHADVQIDAVQNGTGDFILVARDIGGFTTTSFFMITQVPARTRILRRDQLKLARKRRTFFPMLQGDFRAFERFTQRFQRGAVKLGEFIHEQHSTMSQTDFSGCQSGPTSEQGKGRGARVNTAERSAEREMFKGSRSEEQTSEL